MLFISESFTFFPVSCNHVTMIDITLLLHLMTCVTVICDIILYPLPKPKIKKRKEKPKNKIKIKIKIKEKENK